MRLVAEDLEILVPVVRDVHGPAQHRERRQGLRRTCELGIGLLEVIEVEMAVAARPDEVSDREIRLLRQDVRQQGI